MVLPIESYFRTVEQGRAISRAHRILVSLCMSRYGFDYRQPEPPLIPREPFIDRRYGLVSDMKAAERWGYHLPDNGLNVPDAKMTARASTAAEELVLIGRDPVTGQPVTQADNGLTLPEGGCTGEATAKLTEDGGVFGFPEVIREINFESFARSMQDPRVVQVFADWSKCMAEHGYERTKPLDDLPPGISVDTPAPSEAEIAMATWDVACKERTNLDRIWFDVDSELQLQMIEQKAAALTEVRSGNEAMVKKAAEILEKSG